VDGNFTEIDGTALGRITHEPESYPTVMLPHQAPHIGLTTSFSDLCPHLSEPLRRAPDVAKRLRIAKAERRATQAMPPPLPPIVKRFERAIELNVASLALHCYDKDPELREYLAANALERTNAMQRLRRLPSSQPAHDLLDALALLPSGGDREFT
jgi:hypothetical protein